MHSILVAPLVAVALAAAPPEDAAAIAEVEAPRLQLDRLLEEALERNPEIQAFESDRRAASERAVAAGSLPHPTVGFAIRSLPVDSFSFSEDEMTSMEVSVRQQLPLFGKRGLRREVGQKEAEARAALGAAERLVVAEATAGAYADLWLAIESVRVLERQQEMLERLLRLARQRFVVGGQQQADLLRAEVELARVREPLLVWREREREARARLASFLARERPVEGLPEVPLLPMPPAPEALIEGLPRHPELVALDEQRGRAELDATLARREKLPDPEIGLTYGARSNFPDMVGVEIAFPIPVFAASKEDRLAAAATADADAAQRRWRGQRDRLAAAIHGAWAALRAERDKLQLIEEEILPRLRRSSEATVRAYPSGAVDFLTLLDTHLQQIRQEMEALQARAESLRATARLARASGDIGLLQLHRGDIQ